MGMNVFCFPRTIIYLLPRLFSSRTCSPSPSSAQPKMVYEATASAPVNIACIKYVYLPLTHNQRPLTDVSLGTGASATPVSFYPPTALSPSLLTRTISALLLLRVRTRLSRLETGSG